MARPELPFGSRSIDLNCLSEPDRALDKPHFTAVTNLLGRHLDAKPSASLLDIGCSLGGFLQQLRARWPQLRCTGVDVLPQVVEYARRLLPGVDLRVGNVLDPTTLPGNQDIVTLLGIHSIFDEPLAWLDGALSAGTPRVRLVVFGLFNPEDVDTLVRVRRSGPGTPGEWQSGWTLWSRRTIEAGLRERGLWWRWTELAPSRTVPRWSEDPLHSWSAEVDGQQRLVNGSQVIHQQAVLEIARFDLGEGA
ncbi:class I SAM-dependent methyltransferase [Streptomyces sp. NPDC002187]|uniref:class I SAM-dependent methyltransferase n=1 Tax=Streptomyces sp. NPDC002187 TaxID=3364637 RepID=UPI0036C694CD